ncbi:hypothetical protein GN244_ATG07130 [Phytophthora infestans]|uniref:Uncharacterized protein n=1 Tax=Phytophthora infestans TaxID=4787 RepID=A0A833T6J9_PHYIN|nr:hypothetical protein GN244_ATG07130 [Phytophthora infestans]
MWREYEEFRASDPMDCDQDNGESSDEIDQSNSDISMDSDIFIDSDIGMQSSISSTSGNEDGDLAVGRSTTYSSK